VLLSDVLLELKKLTGKLNGRSTACNRTFGKDATEFAFLRGICWSIKEN
jgi:hypothetical protein